MFCVLGGGSAPVEKNTISIFSSLWARGPKVLGCCDGQASTCGFVYTLLPLKGGLGYCVTPGY